MNILFSIAIPTYCRANWLRCAVESTLLLSLDPSEYEVLIIDNNSTDDTEKVSRSYVKQHKHIRYYLEMKQGLCHARNRGWQMARGEYVVYIDDDCKVPVDWLSAGKAIINESAPAAMGGPYYAFYNSPKPGWFQDSYGSHVQGDTARILPQGQFIDGGNLFVRRKILEKLGGFDPKFGMKGKGIGYQDETTLQTRIRDEINDTTILYDPRLYLYHLVRPEVMNPFWKLRSNFAHGKFGFRARMQDLGSAKAARVSWRKAAGAIFGLFWGLGPAMVFRNRDKFPAWQNYVWEVTSNHMKTIGNICEYMRYKP